MTMDMGSRVRERPIMYFPAASTVAKRSAVNTKQEIDYSLNKNRAAQKKKLMLLIDRLSILLTNMTMYL